MRTQSIKYQEKVNPIAASAVGAVSGYALKHILPLSKYEKNIVRDEGVIAIANEAERNARKTIYKKIAQILPEAKITQEAKDVFVKNKDAILNKEFSLDKFDKKIVDDLSDAMKRIDENGIARKARAEEMFEAFAKRNRSTFYFVAAGAIIFASIAILGNSIINTTKNQK